MLHNALYKFFVLEFVSYLLYFIDEFGYRINIYILIQTFRIELEPYSTISSWAQASTIKARRAVYRAELEPTLKFLTRAQTQTQTKTQIKIHLFLPFRPNKTVKQQTHLLSPCYYPRNKTPSSFFPATLHHLLKSPPLTTPQHHLTPFTFTTPT